MTSSAPRFELTRINADGSREPPEIMPLAAGIPGDWATDRRGFLKTGLAAGAVLAALGCTPAMATRQALKAHGDAVNSVAFGPDGTLLASGSDDRTVRLWGIPQGDLLRTISTPSGPVRAVAFSPDGRVLASGDSEGTIELRRMPRGELLRTISDPAGFIHSIAFSPDGRTLAAGSDDHAIRLWKVADGSLLGTISGRTTWALSIAFDPRGEMLAAPGRDGTITLWSVPDGALLGTMSGHTDTVWSVSFCPAGTTLASGSADATIRLWDPADGTLLRTLSGHSAEVRSVAFSPDGRLLASGSTDGTIRLWGMPHGDPLKTISDYTGRVLSLAFGRDSRTLASARSDGAVELWRVPEGALLAALFDPARNQLDMSKEPPSVKGTTYTTRTQSGKSVTYTLPCGSPIPPGATCTCNCVPGTYRPPSSGSYSYCTCNKVCTCVPVYYSDRDGKENFREILPDEILDALAGLPVSAWSYRDDPTGARHIGPTAQDFAAAFATGDSDRHIHVADGIGVALAAIQALYRLVLAQQEQIAELRRSAGSDREEPA